MDSNEKQHLNLKEKAERLKYMFDALNKQKKKYERLKMSRGLSQTEFEQYNEVSQKLDNFNDKCKNFIRPRKNGIGKFSVEDYISWCCGQAGISDAARPQMGLYSGNGASSASDSAADQEVGEQSTVEESAMGSENRGERLPGEWQHEEQHQMEGQTTQRSGTPDIGLGRAKTLSFQDGPTGCRGSEDKSYGQATKGVSKSSQRGFNKFQSDQASIEQESYSPDSQHSAERFYPPHFAHSGRVAYDYMKPPHYHSEGIRKTPPGMVHGFRGSGFYYSRDDILNHRFMQQSMFNGSPAMRNDFYYSKEMSRGTTPKPPIDPGNATPLMRMGVAMPGKTNTGVMSPMMSSRGMHPMTTPRLGGDGMIPGTSKMSPVAHDRGMYMSHRAMSPIMQDRGGPPPYGMMPSPVHGRQMLGPIDLRLSPFGQYAMHGNSGMMPPLIMKDTSFFRGEPGMMSPRMQASRPGRLDPMAQHPRIPGPSNYGHSESDFVVSNIGLNEQRPGTENLTSGEGRRPSQEALHSVAHGKEELFGGGFARESTPNMQAGMAWRGTEHGCSFGMPPPTFSHEDQRFRAQHGMRRTSPILAGMSMQSPRMGGPLPFAGTRTCPPYEHAAEQSADGVYPPDDLIRGAANARNRLEKNPTSFYNMGNGINEPAARKKRGRPPAGDDKKIRRGAAASTQAAGAAGISLRSGAAFKCSEALKEPEEVKPADFHKLNPAPRQHFFEHSFEFKSDAPISPRESSAESSFMGSCDLFSLDIPRSASRKPSPQDTLRTDVYRHSQLSATPLAKGSELESLLKNRKLNLSREVKDRLLIYLDVIMHELITKTCEMVRNKHKTCLTFEDIKAVFTQHDERFKQTLKQAPPTRDMKLKRDAAAGKGTVRSLDGYAEHDSMLRLLEGDQGKL